MNVLETTTLLPPEEIPPSEGPQTESGGKYFRSYNVALESVLINISEDTLYKGRGRPKTYLPSRPLRPQLGSGKSYIKSNISITKIIHAMNDSVLGTNVPVYLNIQNSPKTSFDIQVNV